MTQTSFGKQNSQEWEDKGGLERLDRATKPSSRQGNLYRLYIILSSLQRAMIQPAEATNDIDADSYSGKFIGSLKHEMFIQMVRNLLVAISRCDGNR